MKLYEHPEFADAIKAAKQHFAHPGLTEQFIEKDYYVTEALRIVAQSYPNEVIFKGGTSLSKGWKLIERFSEDIDLFLNTQMFNPSLSKNSIDKHLKNIETLVNGHPGFTLDNTRGNSGKGTHRNSFFKYHAQFLGNQAIANNVYLETGIRSGDYPVEEISISSYLADFLKETGISLGTDDESAFPMKLLHFRRTFVEKLFAIHSRVLLLKEEKQPIATHARHYYDLYCLAQRQEVQEMLNTQEFNNIKYDCFIIGQQHFNNYQPPENLSFSKSIAIFPTGDLRQLIAKEYSQQCKSLCYGDYPKWEEIESCFEQLRNIL